MKHLTNYEENKPGSTFMNFNGEFSHAGLGYVLLSSSVKYLLLMYWTKHELDININEPNITQWRCILLLQDSGYAFRF